MGSLIHSEFHSDHGSPVTRRDFISRCATGFTGAVAGWHLLSLTGLASKAFADAGEETSIPFLVFDLAGGAALPGNFLVGGQGGPEDLLSNYDLLGWNPRAASALDRRFGLPMASANIGKVLEAMLQAMSPGAQANLRMGSLLHFAQDDTGGNPLSTLTLISKVSRRGEFIQAPLGLIARESGGNSESVRKDPTCQPLVIQTLTDVLEANGMGPVLQRLSGDAKQGLIQSLMRLAELQKRAFDGRPSSDRLAMSADEAFKGLPGALSNATALDPIQDPEARAVYQLEPNSPQNGQSVLFGAIVMNALKRNSGPGVLTIGGCDYHDGTQATGDAKDAEIGREIGRAVELAHRYKQPLFFQVITDGGVYSKQGSRAWQGDAGNKCMTVLGYYRPDGAPKYKSASSVQIGNYTSGQGVDTGTLIGGKPALAAYAAFANYLQINGKLRDFDRYAGGVFSSKELESVLVFA
jgi:hypothetical protein